MNQIEKEKFNEYVEKISDYCFSSYLKPYNVEVIYIALNGGNYFSAHVKVENKDGEVTFTNPANYDSPLNAMLNLYSRLGRLLPKYEEGNVP